MWGNHSLAIYSGIIYTVCLDDLLSFYLGRDASYWQINSLSYQSIWQCVLDKLLEKFKNNFIHTTYNQLQAIKLLISVEMRQLLITQCHFSNDLLCTECNKIICTAVSSSTTKETATVVWFCWWWRTGGDFQRTV